MVDGQCTSEQEVLVPVTAARPQLPPLGRAVASRNLLGCKNRNSGRFRHSILLA